MGKHFTAVTAGTCLLMAAESVIAAGKVENIVVTARKKEENLQSVPISISAFSSEELEDRGILTLEGLAQQTPGLEFASSGAATSDRPIIRGLAQQTRVGDEVNVSTFVDGVYTPGFSGTTSILFDALERVEVIRGPQSAVYGRNSFAGAINYITKRPQMEFDFGGRGTAGNKGREAFSGFVTGPVFQDKVALRLDGGYSDSGGTFKNSLNGDRLNGTKTDFARASLLAQPGDRLDIFGTVMYQKDDLTPAPQTVIPRVDPRRAGKPPLGQVSPFETLYMGQVTGVPQNIGRRAIGKLEDENAVFVQDLYAGGKRKVWRGSVNVDYDVGDFTFSSLTGYQDREARFFSDLDETADGTLFVGPGLPPGGILSQTGSGPWEDRQEFSQDLRVQYDAGGDYNWSAGVYFSDEDFQEKRYRWGDPAVSTSNAILPAPPPQVDTNSKFDNKFKSVYGAFELRLSDYWTFAAEGRYTREEKSAKEREDNYPSDEIPVGDLGTEDFDYFTPRITLSYFPFDQAMLYVQGAKGVKSGGFNPNAGISPEIYATLPPAEQARLAGAQAEQTYETENNWTYEVGGKFTFWDDRAQVNVAFYFVDWENQQILTLSTDVNDPLLALSASNPIIGNIGRSESKGMELESTVQPAEWLRLNLGYAYADPEYKEATFGTSAGWEDCASIPGLDCDDAGLSTGNVDGNQLPNTSKYSLNAGAEVSQPIGDGAWSAFIRGDYLYRSKRYTDAENVGSVPSADVVNLRLGARSDSWIFEGFCNNILKEDAPVFGFASRDFFGVPNFTMVNREGRFCGVQVSYNHN